MSTTTARTPAAGACPSTAVTGRLLASGLRIERGRQLLVDALDFTVPSGAALMLRGANGSGKSTLLRALLGLTPVQAGELTWENETFRPGTRKLCPHALWLGHAHGLKGELSAIDNLRLLAELDGARPDRARLRGVLERAGLAKRTHVETRRLSQGQRQRLALARLLLAPHRPLWLLDEPSAALDAEGSALLDALLNEHLDAGGSALIATHLPVLAARAPNELWLGAKTAPGAAPASRPASASGPASPAKQVSAPSQGHTPWRGHAP